MALAVLALAYMLNGCEKKAPAPAPSVRQEPPATASPANARKSPEALRLPEDARTPPAAAVAGPNGTRWLTLAPGNQSRPDDHSSVRAELSIWTWDGKLLFSTYSSQGTSVFTMTSPQPFEREQLKKLGVGGRARAWFPAGTAGSWAPPAWRQSALIVEIEIASIAESSILVYGQAAASRPYRFDLPDAAGPPVGASKAPQGVRFVYLARASGTAASKAARVRLELTAWPTRGIMLGEPLLRQRQTTTTVSRAPQAVAGILGGMRVGETVRVWLPPQVAAALLPVPASSETVVDVTLLAVE
jgi:hypothetical protein